MPHTPTISIWPNLWEIEILFKSLSDWEIFPVVISRGHSNRRGETPLSQESGMFAVAKESQKYWFSPSGRQGVMDGHLLQLYWQMQPLHWTTPPEKSILSGPAASGSHSHIFCLSRLPKCSFYFPGATSQGAFYCSSTPVNTNTLGVFSKTKLGISQLKFCHLNWKHCYGEGFSSSAFNQRQPFCSQCSNTSLTSLKHLHTASTLYPYRFVITRICGSLSSFPLQCILHRI